MRVDMKQSVESDRKRDEMVGNRKEHAPPQPSKVSGKRSKLARRGGSGQYSPSR